MSREAFERHCPMPKGLVFNASLNRYDGGVYTSALSYNDMWCAWQHAWQAALQSGEPVAWMSPNKQSLEFSRPDTVYGSHTIPLYASPQPVVPEGYVLVPRAAATEVLRTSSNRGGAWEEIRSALLSAGKENNTHKHTVAILTEKWDDKTVTSAPFCIVCGESAGKGGE